MTGMTTYFAQIVYIYIFIIIISIYIYISGQITIIHQPEIRPFWGDSPH